MPVSIMNGKLLVVSNRSKIIQSSVITPPDPDPDPTGNPPTYAPDHTWPGIGGRFVSQHIQTFGAGTGTGPARIVREGAELGSIINSGTGEYQWNNLDNQINKFLTQGIEVLIHISYNNIQLTGSGSIPNFIHTCIPNPNGPNWDAWSNEWSNVARDVVNRYHKNGNARPTTGILANKINAGFYVKFYEIYNEHNHWVFWKLTQANNNWQDGPINADAYADLLIKTYDKCKAISPDVIIGNGGYGGAPGLPDAVGGRPIKSWYWAADTLRAIGEANYKKKTNGWGDLPQDFICAHPYQGGRPGSGNGPPAAPYGPRLNHISGEYSSGIPKVHNAFVRAGFSKLKIWGTEAGYGYSVHDVPGVVRTTNGMGLQRWNGTAWIQSGGSNSGERKLASPQESYNYVKDHFRIWQGLENFGLLQNGTTSKWPVGSELEKFIIGNENAQDALGPLWWFSAIDFDTDLMGTFYETDPYRYEEHYGFLSKDGTPKTKGGSPKTAYNYFMEEL